MRIVTLALAMYVAGRIDGFCAEKARLRARAAEVRPAPLPPVPAGWSRPPRPDGLTVSECPDVVPPRSHPHFNVSMPVGPYMPRVTWLAGETAFAVRAEAISATRDFDAVADYAAAVWPGGFDVETRNDIVRFTPSLAL